MAGKTILTDANTKPIFKKSLQPIESSTQEESVPVEIVQEDKDESISDEGVRLLRVCLFTRKELKLNLRTARIMKIFQFKFCRRIKMSLLLMKGVTLMLLVCLLTKTKSTFRSISTTVMTQLTEQLSPRIPLSFHLILLLAFH